MSFLEVIQFHTKCKRYREIYLALIFFAILLLDAYKNKWFTEFSLYAMKIYLINSFPYKVFRNSSQKVGGNAKNINKKTLFTQETRVATFLIKHKYRMSHSKTNRAFPSQHQCNYYDEIDKTGFDLHEIRLYEEVLYIHRSEISKATNTSHLPIFCLQLPQKQKQFK